MTDLLIFLGSVMIIKSGIDKIVSGCLESKRKMLISGTVLIALGLTIFLFIISYHVNLNITIEPAKN